MNRKILISLVVSLILLIIFGIYLISQNSDNKISKIIKDNTPSKIKVILKKTIFYLPLLKRENQKLLNENILLNKKFEKSNLEKLYFENIYKLGGSLKKDIQLDDNKYNLNYYIAPFYNEDLHKNKKSAYLELYENNIIIVFTSGKIVFVDKLKLIKDEVFKFVDIANNFSDLNLFDSKIKWTGIKDIKIFNGFLLASVTEEIKKDCYSTSLVFAKLSNKFMKFEHIFKPDECVDKTEDKSKKPFKFFNGYQTGGRIEMQGEYIYLTIGDYNSWELPQSNKSVFGKLIKINFNTKEYKIISKGHRNSQGLTFLDRDNLIFTDHGPKGGDEVNILNLKDKNIKNFGWPLASYGYHYDIVPINGFTKKYAPLLKSHKKNGFEEPIYFFEKSIGISQIIENHYLKDHYFVSSLKNKTLYNLKINKNLKTSKIKNEVNVGERIRDIIYDKKENLYFLYLENEPNLLVFQKN